MKSKKLEYWSKGVMGGHGVEESWSDGLATDGTRTCTDSEKTMNRREPRELPRRGWKTGADGKEWVGRRVNLGKGGQVAVKWTGFSHFEPALTRLFPHDSMQVVDFPRMYVVSQAELGTNVENGKGAEAGAKLCKPSVRLCSRMFA
jgi:hypothetical protein